MKSIVKNGQLEFVAGGWVQNDEANANFDIVIDQVRKGEKTGEEGREEKKENIYLIIINI